MGMNWDNFLRDFQTGHNIGNELGAQYALKQLQGQEVTEIPGAAREMNSPQAGQVMPQPKGIPQPSGAETFPVGETPIAANPGVSGTGLPPPAPPPPPEPSQYSFMGTTYGQKPTDLEMDQARGNARADIYERFGKPAMAIAARTKADALGAQAEQSKLRGFQLRDFERTEERQLKATAIDDLMQRAYNGDSKAQMEVFKKYPRTTVPGIGEIRIFSNDDGSVKVTVKDEKTGKPMTLPYKSLAEIPPEQLSGMLQGAAPSLYAELGGEYASDARRDQIQMAQYGLSMQGQQLQNRRFDENVRQFNVTQKGREGERAQAQKNWKAQMGMDIFRFNDAHNLALLKEKGMEQVMVERALKIKTMKKPPPEKWHIQKQILEKPWEHGLGLKIWAMGLDATDPYTTKALEVWEATAERDYNKRQLASGTGGAVVPPLN